MTRLRSEVRRRQTAGWMGLWTLLVAGLLVYVGEQVEALRRGYRVQALRAEVTELENENRYLRVQMGALAARKRLRQLAEQYGMGPVPAHHLIVLPE